MGRTVAVVWHASFSVAAGVLYFFFVLPRWPELLGDTSHTLGTVLRIVTGALIGLAALPVVFTLLRTRRPEFGTPQLALTLRTSSIALHVLAGCGDHRHRDQPRSGSASTVPASGCSASTGPPRRSPCSASSRSTWPSWPSCRRLRPSRSSPRRPNRAVAVAARPPTRRPLTKRAEDDEATTPEDEAEDNSESASDEKAAEVTAEAAEPESSAEEPEPTADEEPATEDDKTEDAPPDERPAQSTNGRLRNRRRRRVLGRVAVED